MQPFKDFSAQSIKQNADSLPDTYYGEECNVSLKSRHISISAASDGEPLRFSNLGIVLCNSGQISSEQNLSPQTAVPGDFELIFPGTIYRFKEISDDCELIGIAISPFLLNGILREEDKAFFGRVGINLKVRLDEDERALFNQLAKVYLQALQRYGESSNLCREMTLCIIQFALQVCTSGRVSRIGSGSRVDELFGRFVMLLSQAKGTKRTIGWFAEQLCVSNHHLSMSVKQASGQTVKSLIDNAVIMEIKVLLRHSDLSVSQIADTMEFPNSSFLCKFFKAQTGTTPLHYRCGR